jgi:hypothetical protein
MDRALSPVTESNIVVGSMLGATLSCVCSV